MAASFYRRVLLAGVAAAFSVVSGAAVAAEMKVVSGPSADPQCFVPWAQRHQVLAMAEEARPLPHRARQRLHRQHLAHPDDQDRQGLCRRSPRSSRKLKEFKVVSTGEDVAAQIAAINNFIDSGYDAIVVDAQNPTAFGPVDQARQGRPASCWSPSTTSLDTEEAINVDVDQKGLGVLLGRLAGQEHSRTAARSSKCAASPAPRSTPTATTASTRR